MLGAREDPAFADNLIKREQTARLDAAGLAVRDSDPWRPPLERVRGQVGGDGIACHDAAPVRRIGSPPA
jgi:hypothetical protein